MGEAKRKARQQAGRPWAQGSLKVVANKVECFDWRGTRDDAVALQKQYLAAVNTLGVDAQSYGRRAAGYLMAFGPPKVGEPRLTPSGFGEPWAEVDVDLNKGAVLWSVLREHIPNTGAKVEDVFVGKKLLAMFNGDREAILAETERERRGEPFSGDDFQMMVAVLSENYPLDPAEAVAMSEEEFCELAYGKGLPDRAGEIYLPRIPHDGTEALAMAKMLTILADTTEPVADPKDSIRTYAGYTDAELMRGKPGVRVR